MLPFQNIHAAALLRQVFYGFSVFKVIIGKDELVMTVSFLAFDERIALFVH